MELNKNPKRVCIAGSVKLDQLFNDETKIKDVKQILSDTYTIPLDNIMLKSKNILLSDEQVIGNVFPDAKILYIVSIVNRQKKEVEEEKVLCKNNCGFFGSTNGLCSKCAIEKNPEKKKKRKHKENMSSTKKSKKTRKTKKEDDQDNKITEETCGNEIQKNVDTITVEHSHDNSQEKTKRCLQCNKKLHLLSFTCKCGNEYCVAHRFGFSHNCSIENSEYQKDARDKLKNVLIECKAEKVKKI